MINTRNGIDVLSDSIAAIQSPQTGVTLAEWPNLSELVGGLRMHEFTIFCGATGSGKTQWLAALVSQLIKNGIKCFVAPVETGSTDFGIRVLSVLSKFDFNTGASFNKEQIRKLMMTVETHVEQFKTGLFFSSHENRVSVEEMVQTLHYMNEEKGCKVAVLDNLNFFLKPTGANNMVMEFDDAIHKFVMLAKKIPMHIILVMHPKKTNEGKILSEFDIKGSSTAVQEASNVLLMNRLSDDEIPTNGSKLTREFCFRKIRKRGFNVGKKFYMDYEGGAYVERNNETSPENKGFKYRGNSDRRAGQ